ncbi:MAG: response regulator [Cypionkella sp.]
MQGPSEREAAEHRRTADAAALAADEAGTTILVVDDEVLIRMTVCEELADHGYRCLEAASGAEALRLLAERSDIALLLTDMGLPGGLNGRQVADSARQARPGLPVLFVTGYADQTALAGGTGPGTAVLAKPFRMAELVETVRALIAR